MKLILTCEHAGNEVPQCYKYLFSEAGEVLETHRGYDPGALDLFVQLKELAFFSSFQKVSRLLVENNRSLHHPQLFSEFTEKLTSEEKNEILENYYFPHRDLVEQKIAKVIAGGEEVIHVSVHTFTPQLNGEVRRADIGFLYDPSRKREKTTCINWRKKLQKQDLLLKLRFNFPYLGKSDGFTSHLRTKFPQNYMGIELEVNQKFVSQNTMNGRIKKEINHSLAELLKE